MGSFGGLEWLIIILILLFFFGAKKIPQMARGLGQGFVEFKKASRKDEDENPESQDKEKTTGAVDSGSERRSESGVDTSGSISGEQERAERK